MTAVMAVWSFLRKLPREAWLFALGLSVALALVLGVRQYGATQYDAGKRAAAAGVSFDSALVARVAEVVAQRTAHTDTVTQRVITTRWKVDTLVRQLPPEVLAIPEVKALAVAVNTLTVQVDSLTTAHAAERLATIERAKVDSASIFALRVISTAQRDTIMQLQQRPRWRTVVGALAVGVVGGMVAR